MRLQPISPSCAPLSRLPCTTLRRQLCPAFVCKPNCANGHNHAGALRRDTSAWETRAGWTAFIRRICVWLCVAFDTQERLYWWWCRTVVLNFNWTTKRPKPGRYLYKLSHIHNDKTKCNRPAGNEFASNAPRTSLKCQSQTTLFTQNLMRAYKTYTYICVVMFYTPITHHPRFRSQNGWFLFAQYKRNNRSSDSRETTDSRARFWAFKTTKYRIKSINFD